MSSLTEPRCYDHTKISAILKPIRGAIETGREASQLRVELDRCTQLTMEVRSSSKTRLQGEKSTVDSEVRTPRPRANEWLHRAGQSRVLLRANQGARARSCPFAFLVEIVQEQIFSICQFRGVSWHPTAGCTRRDRRFIIIISNNYALNVRFKAIKYQPPTASCNALVPDN